MKNFSFIGLCKNAKRQSIRKNTLWAMHNLTCSVNRIEVFRYFRLISDPSVIKRIKNTPTIKLLNKNKSNDELLQKTPQKKKL